ncbi:MAG: hypothetical protein HZB33_05025 [Nitrospirae bacterium]|nr:hypothetical protein [Nitrospirota bacterium]
MAKPIKKIAKKTVTKKTASKKTVAGKSAPKKVAPKVKSKKTAVAKIVSDNKPLINKGSRLACQVCGFAITVDHIGGYVEEAYLVCCETPMKLKRPTANKK